MTADRAKTNTPGMNQVRALRLRAGLTQTELAAQLGVSKSKMSKIESCTQQLNEGQIRTLARIFGVHPGAVLEPIDPTTIMDGLTEDDRDLLKAILSRLAAA